MFFDKKSFKNIKRIKPKLKKKGFIYLNRNERSFNFENKINSRIINKLKKIHLGYYPEVDILYKKISEWIKINKENIFIVEGVTGGIKLIFDSIDTSKRKKIISPFPTFSLYPIFTQLNNLEFVKISYDENFELDTSKLLKEIDKNTLVVFLPNPNVPIEGYLEKNIIKEIAKKCLKEKCLLVIDEVYFHFGSESSIKLINDFENIIVLRSFSKAFGLPGLRLGYVLSNKENIQYLSKNRSGYEANSLTIEYGIFFIDNFKFIEKYISEIKKSLKYIRFQMHKLNIKTVGGYFGNFIYIEFPNKNKCKKVVKSLEKKKIVVRGGWPYPYDKGILVSGTSKKNTIIFVKYLKEILKKI